jgi:hypothetical protein
MGTVRKNMWIPTDVNMTVGLEWYEDLEDGDVFSEKSREIACENNPSAEERERLESVLRDLLHSHVDERVEQVISDIDYAFEWHVREIEVCQWCDSSGCEGDSACDEAPEWCDGCEEYTNRECDCVYCEECEEYNCSIDHSGPAKVTIDSVRAAANIESKLEMLRELIAAANADEVEAEL